MTHVATLCGLCPLGQNDFAAKLTLPGFQVRVVDCMSGCTKSSTMSFRAPGKTAYLFGQLSEGDLPGLVTFAAAYLASPDGEFTDTLMFGTLRTKALARIPG
jgi:predicted metal-binding protein